MGLEEGVCLIFIDFNIHEKLWITQGSRYLEHWSSYPAETQLNLDKTGKKKKTNCKRQNTNTQVDILCVECVAG